MLVRTFVAAFVMLFLTPPAFGDTAARPAAGSFIQAVQPPAWLVEGTVTMPLAPGLQVHDGDSLRTGAGARVYVTLPDESIVELGENTEFATPTLEMVHDERGGVFKGVLHIVKGVFRFTTSLAGKNERRRVDIQVGAATIGIRGTDVWGRTGPGGSLVALLEGKARMSMPGHAKMMMDQPMHYLMMSAGGGMKMHMPVTKKDMADWAAQTDMEEGAGVLSRGGPWTVALASSTNARHMERLRRQLAAAGYPVEYSLVTMNGRRRLRLVIHQAATRRDARALAASLARRYPSLSPKVLAARH